MLGTISLGVLLVSLKLSDQAPGSKHSALHLHPEPSPLAQPSLPGPGQGPEGTLPRPSARAMPTYMTTGKTIAFLLSDTL